MVKKVNIIIHKMVLFLMALVLTVICIVTFSHFTKAYAYANEVYFKDLVVDANDSNLIIAEVVVSGNPFDTVSFKYHTESKTAIKNVDFTYVKSEANVIIDSSGTTIYKISIKCLNDSNNIEKLRVSETKDGNELVYGRYFNLIIDEATNASLVTDKNICKCYVAYNYKVSATTGILNDYSEEVAYLNDYNIMQSKSHGGKDDIDGQETWKTWENGVSFNNDISKRWTNAYIDSGIASAYTTFFAERIDSSYIRSGNQIQILAGGKQFIDKYARKKSADGMYLYFATEPEWNVKNRLTPKAMSLIGDYKNAYDSDSDYVHSLDIHIHSEKKNIYWIQNGNTWYASNRAFLNSTFYKVDPYNGVLDSGVAVFNTNSEFDRQVKNIYLLLKLVDDRTPEIVGEYVDDSSFETDQKLRIMLRFNEPVYSSKINTQASSSLAVRLNNSATTYEAKYVEGNYTDTLVYEFTPPKAKITSISYQLPTLDIGDMACNLDIYKNIKNNLIPRTVTDVERVIELDGDINLSRPTIKVDTASSNDYHNIYNLMLSINGNGESDLNTGTVYYSFTKSQYFIQPSHPSSYDHSYRIVEDDMGSFGITLTKNTELDIGNGTYYLHVLAISDYGLKTYDCFGPYKLDVEPPVVINKTPSVNELQYKEFELEFMNKDNGVELNDLKLVAKYYNSEGKLVSKSLDLITDGVIESNLRYIVSVSDTTNSRIYKYKSDISSDAEYKDTFISALMGLNPRLDIDISFEVIDEAGNKVKSNSNKVSYDKREVFDTTVEVPTVSNIGSDGYYPITDIDLGTDVYDISGIINNKDIEISITSESDRQILTNSILFSVDINGIDTIYGSEDAPYLVKLSDLAPGYYEITPKITGVSEETGTEYNLVSRTISFYLTDGMNDETINRKKVDSNLVLINKVFELPDTMYYYLDKNSTTVLRQLYGAKYDPYTDKYVGGSSSPAFSSSVEAKKYLRYMEYQDLYLLKISANVASLLNQGSGTTTYIKAQGETVIAQEGQLWIRYKRTTWTSSSNAYGWAFYYYGNGNESDGIDINGLSDNLKNAIESIVKKIAADGKEINLVTEDTINQRTGAPYLSEFQVHIEKEVANTSMTGSSYLVNPTYLGDQAIYDNKVTVLNENYALATNMELIVTPSTKFYYKCAGEGPWIELIASDGDILSRILPNNVSGYYIIREYSNSGISEYGVYIDKTAPTLKVNINDNEQYLDNQIVNFSGNSFVIKELLNEIDPYGYVAIYTYPSKRLLDVLYASDLLSEYSNGYVLNNGNYYIQVGDRSGNIIIYTVLLSSTELNVQVIENDSKTAVIVKVLNRDEDEIYLYEVYLNEILITNEFMPQRIFRAPGVYRIYIVDIYSNTYESIAEHDLQMPKLDWYYQIPTGEYYKYDEANISNMNIAKDSEATRTYNVYTSSLLRIKFLTDYNDSDIKYEIIGLNSGDYTYSKQFNTITFNVLDGFKIKVWYEDYPENSYLYIIQVDNDAPNISATFMGTAYYGVVEFDDNGNVIWTSSYDYIDYSKYEIDDPITLDTLDYRTTGLSKLLSFYDGYIINGSRIVLKVNDMSDIRSYSVYRNGQPITAELNSDNEIKLNGYGKYDITITDMLNNTTTFSFINITSTLDGLSRVSVDENDIRTDKASYGNEAIILDTYYPGQTKILVKYGDICSTYIVNFDGQYITYGQYYCVYETEDGSELTSKTKEFRTNNNFYLDIKDSSFRENYWYRMISNDGYTVYAKFENGLVSYKVINNEDKINVELLYCVNSIVLPERYIIELSKEVSSLELLTGNEIIDTTGTSKYIYISKDLTIGEVTDSNITKILVAYSDTPEFEELETIYENGAFTSEFIGIDEGYYQIVVENKYGNKTIYLINKIDSLDFIIYTYYKDGTSKEFLLNDQTIYANDSIKLSIFSDEIRFEVNGQTSETIYSGGMASIELYNDGSYTVRAIGLNGIVETFSFVIGTDIDFSFDEEWITGYNDRAILKNQGYTNNILSIIKNSNVKFIEYKYNDRYEILYDEISDNKLIDITRLENSIGVDGIGVYEIYFRNIYGDLVSKTIHYNNIPALKLSRKTVDEKAIFNEYDLDIAINKNFYSNYMLRFETDSNNYIFTIDGNVTSLAEPKIIEFSNSSGNGSFGYHITYLDEYGNYVEFDAELYRKEVSIDTSCMTEINLNNDLYTKDNIKILFDGELKATVSINDRSPIEYNSGYTYYKDGKYEFIVEDIAGNRKVYTINHKSVNRYTLYDNKTEQSIINGSVINNSAVVFESYDNSTIQSVFRDGIKLEDYNSRLFSSTGHYEILVGDSIGNISYSEFYIINNSLVGFEYSAPIDYIISEVWYTNNLGQRALVLQNQESINLNVDGDYTVIVTSEESITSFNYSVTIDNTLPQAKLEGVENGGITARNVRLINLKNGDRVEIYKNGRLINVTVVSSSERPPEISEGGNYKVVVTNLAGAKVEYNFTRKQIANSATSVFVIIICFVVIAGISIGLIYHTRLKTDS